MNTEIIRSVLLWCTILNYAILTLWFLVFALGRPLLQRIHGRWFRLAPEQFDLVHYAGMAVYKVGILLFNLAPYCALLIAT